MFASGYRLSTEGIHKSAIDSSAYYNAEKSSGWGVEITQGNVSQLLCINKCLL